MTDRKPYSPDPHEKAFEAESDAARRFADQGLVGSIRLQRQSDSGTEELREMPVGGGLPVNMTKIPDDMLHLTVEIFIARDALVEKLGRVPTSDEARELTEQAIRSVRDELKAKMEASDGTPHDADH